MLALLLFAGGFALGLFFGWLLHRERVERALYEDVVRARDRATSTLAETSARLELANRDAVRLREQLTTAQRELTERDATIARLRREGADAPADAPSDALAGGFEEAEVTEEVVPTGEFPLDGAADEERELVGEAEEDLELVDEPDDGGPPAAAGGAAVPATDDVESDVVEEAELAVADEQAAAGLLDELPDGDGGVEDDDELVAAGSWYDREPEEADGAPATAAAPAPDDEPTAAPSSGIGTPLVLEADADDAARPAVPDEAPAPATGGDAVDDDLRQIAGVGPALERELRSEGITSYRALALLDERTIAELGGRRPRLVTRLRRDDWVAQARRLYEEAHGTAP